MLQFWSGGKKTVTLSIKTQSLVQQCHLLAIDANYKKVRGDLKTLNLLFYHTQYYINPSIIHVFAYVHIISWQN